MCNAPKMDNIHYIEDATAFQQSGKTYLLTTDKFGKNTGIFGAGILWEMKNGIPEYFYGCTRADVNGSGKSQCYVFKIHKF